MVALDPLAMLELEASLESWDSPDPREPLYVKIQNCSKGQRICVFRDMTLRCNNSAVL